MKPNNTTAITVAAQVLLMNFNFSLSMELSTKDNMQIKVLTAILQKLHYCTLIHMRTPCEKEGSSLNYFYESLNNSVQICDINSYNFEGTLPSLQFSSTSCTIVLTSLSVSKKGCENVIEKFSEIISSEQSIIRRDEDFFIFLTDDDGESAETSHQLLLRSEIFRKTRFRFVLDNQKNRDSSVSILSSNLFQDHFHTLGKFSSGDDKLENVDWSKLFIDFTSNLQGHALTVAATNRYFPTFEVQNISKTEYIDKRGIISIIHKEIRKQLNTTYKIFVCNGFGVVPDGHSGFPLKNGSWVGCMGDIINRRADLAMVVTCDANRYPHVECGATPRFTYITFITRKPKKFLSWKAIYRSFTKGMWTAIFVTVLMATLITWAGESLRDDDNNIKISLKRFVNIFFNLVKPIVSQPVNDMKAVSSKCVTVFWLLYTLIISTAYTSKLTALLTFPETERVPRTWVDLSHSNFVTGAPKSFSSGLGVQIFKNSPSKTSRMLYSKMNFDSDDLTCILNTKGSNCAYLTWEVSLDFIIGTRFAHRGKDSEFLLARDSLNQMSVGFVAQKREPLRHRINNFIRMSFDSGLLNEIYAMDKRNVRISMLNKEKSSGTLGDENNEGNDDGHAKPLTLWNIQGSLLIFAVGSALAIFISSLELAIKRVRGNLKHHHHQTVLVNSVQESELGIIIDTEI